MQDKHINGKLESEAGVDWFLPDKLHGKGVSDQILKKRPSSSAKFKRGVLGTLDTIDTPTKPPETYIVFFSYKTFSNSPRYTPTT